MSEALFTAERLLVIAEAGVNHNGDVECARRMIEVAKECGADVVKFQTWITDKVYSRAHSIKPEYQKAGTANEGEYETIKRLELSFDAFRALKAHAERVGIVMLSTPDEEESADFLLDDLALPLVKVASQDITNTPFLAHLAAKGRPMIVSTGTAEMAEVAAAVAAVRVAGPDTELALLHCTSCYPAEPDAANLRAIETLHTAFQVPVGYSDHTTGMAVACGAVALGACIVEKHFTLSRNMPGPDQQASLEPAELSAYVRAIRDVHRAMGDGVKRPHPSEMANRTAMRRFAVAAADLPVGHRLGRDDILLKKAAWGVPPALVGLLLGSTLRRAVSADDRLTFDLVELPARSGTIDA